jgi:MFS family permease
VAALFLCHLSSGMVGLAMLLAAEHATGSYAVAGTVVGLYAVALALGAPTWGRVADAWGPRRALGSAAALQAAALVGFVVALGTSAPWGCSPP